MIFNDEAMYLFQFRDYKTTFTLATTNFFKIFQPFYTDDIHLFRIITYIILNLSTFSLFFALGRYFKTAIHPVFIAMLGLCFNFFTWQASNIVLQNYIANTVLCNFILTFMVLAATFAKSTYLVPSGFFTGIFLFDGIPNTVLLVPMLLYVFLVFEKKNFYLYLLGILIGILYYFIFVEHPSEFFKQLEFVKEYKVFHRKQHPDRLYFYWIVYLFIFLIIPLIISIYFDKKFKIRNSIIGILLVTNIITLFFKQNIYVEYLLLSFLLYTAADSLKDRSSLYLLILICLLPFGLAFGSNMPFEIRGRTYTIYYIIVLLIIINLQYTIKAYVLFLLFFLYSMYNFYAEFNDKSWKGFIYSEQTEKVNVNGYSLYFDKQRKKELDALRPYLQNQKNVIYSQNKLMGYLYILHAEPPMHTYFVFRQYMEYLIRKQNKVPDDYIYLESEKYPFNPKDFTPLTIVTNPADYKIIHVEDFTIYLPKNYKQK